VNRLRNRLILAFLAATLAPLGVTLFVTASLLEQSFSYDSISELDEISKSLKKTGRELYERACADLKNDIRHGKLEPTRYAAAERSGWPAEAAEFAASGEAERCVPSGQGARLEYLVKHGSEIWSYSTDVGVRMDDISRQYRRARALVELHQTHDMRRGITKLFVVLAAAIWLLSLALVVYLSHRISRPIGQLTEGLSRLAAGDLGTRLPEPKRNDEVGRAMQAFNYMAGQLEQSTKRLVYLTQLASWQTLARKMAHEVKNSLTPIRLTVEEMMARHAEADRSFMEQAAQIVVEEVESLERRVQAFSRFAAEPPVNPMQIDVNAVVEERIAFLKTAHPEIAYSLRLTEERPKAVADPDLVRGILTNLLENAAEAAGEGGRILGLTSADEARVIIEVHDSGPGLSEQARRSLFQPTISFKKGGMGLGLSIARKSALASGGDIVPVKGELGGAAFRVLLPVVANGVETRPDRG